MPKILDHYVWVDTSLCLLNRLFRRRSKKTSKLHVTGLCARNSPGTGEFPAQMASNAENVSIWSRHHAWSGSRFGQVMTSQAFTWTSVDLLFTYHELTSFKYIWPHYPMLIKKQQNIHKTIFGKYQAFLFHYDITETRLQSLVNKCMLCRDLHKSSPFHTYSCACAVTQKSLLYAIGN